MLLATALLWPLSLAVSKPSIIITDGLDKAAITLLQDSGANVVQRHLSMEELEGGALQDYDAIIIRSATSLSEAAVQSGAAGKLRVIGRAGVGVDNVDVSAASAAGCHVLNTPGASTRSVAELTLAHMLAAARGVQAADAGLKSGRWLKGKIKLNADGGPRQGHELAGKRLGIIGFGRIARAVARLGSALGMEVCAFSRSPDATKAAGMGVELKESVTELLRSCTHVVVLCALSSETRGLINSDRIKLLPQVGADGTPCGAHLFNMARGGIVVENDAAAALVDGTLSTYATDVFEKEPPPPDNPLLSCDNFHGTPHVGAATLEAQARVGEIIARNVLATLNGNPPDLGDGVVAAPADAC